MKRRIQLSLFISVVFCLFISIPVFGGVVQYTYDSLNRLIRVEYTGMAGVEYAYNATGNRTSKRVSSLDSDGDSLPPANYFMPSRQETGPLGQIQEVFKL
jgi:YD repeat-containing protein